MTHDAADREAIRTLLEAYADAVIRRDADAWSATWAEDAVWTLMGTPISGRAAIAAAWVQAMAGFPFAGFFCQLGALRIDGDRATGRSYTNEIFRTADGAVRRLVGGYEDRYVRQDGRWLFAARSFTPLMEH